MSSKLKNTGASKASPQPKDKRFAFTSWIQPQCNMKLVEYMCYQEEVCPSTNLIHFQGYVEFFKEYTFGQVKQIFKDKKMHVEIARNSRIHNLNYCTKKRTYKNIECGGKRFLYNSDAKNDVEVIFNLDTLNK